MKGPPTEREQRHNAGSQAANGTEAAGGPIRGRQPRRAAPAATAAAAKEAHKNLDDHLVVVVIIVVQGGPD